MSEIFSDYFWGIYLANNQNELFQFQKMLDQEEVTKFLLDKGYEYEEYLGKGGFSHVFLCYSKKYNQQFAIKRILKQKSSELEYNNLINLDHTNIIRLYDTFEDETSQYLVMDYCSKGTMKQKGILSYEEFVYYSKQILEAISYCHSNRIAHRDLKPDNIFIDQYDYVKVADFGMAKYFDNQEMSTEKCGTFKYFPPEMFQHQEIDPFKADIWSLGITFYYMATGSFPFQSDSKEKLEKMIINCDIDFKKFNLDPRVQFLIKKMTMKSQDHRPTAEKLLELSIFKNPNLYNDKSFGKLSIAFFRNKSHSYFCNTFDLDNKENKSNDNENPKKILKLNLHSYQSINKYKNLRRLSSHYLPIKTF